jgi:C4-dicarboxylate-specific signal transduction histidine kinase
LRRHLKLNSEDEKILLRPEFASFLEAVNQAYLDFDQDRALIERSQELSSKELQSASATLIHTQMQLASAAKMSALGEMAGGVAHEINTPLATILLIADKLHEAFKNGESDPEKDLKSVEIILKTVERIGKIVKGMRLFAGDRGTDPMLSVRVDQIIGDTLSLCQQRFYNGGVTVEVKGLEASDLEIECRPTEISQIVLNLLNNAYDAVEPLTERWIQIHVADRASDVHITVTDSGPGIPANLREKIMQPFFTTKELGKGTGLGLSISASLAEAHGGRLFVDENTKTTRFVLKLPKKQAVTQFEHSIENFKPISFWLPFDLNIRCENPRKWRCDRQGDRAFLSCTRFFESAG